MSRSVCHMQRDTCGQRVVSVPAQHCRTTALCNQICSGERQFVCGSDNKLYRNECEMKRDNCGWVHACIHFLVQLLFAFTSVWGIGCIPVFGQFSIFCKYLISWHEIRRFRFEILHRNDHLGTHFGHLKECLRFFFGHFFGSCLFYVFINSYFRQEFFWSVNPKFW